MESNTRARKPVSEEVAYQRMARLCSMREYATFDIRQKLQRMQLDEGVVRAILSRLEKHRFIDDARFARSFISDKLRFGKWGRAKIVYALRQRQVPQEIIDEAFDALPDEAVTRQLRPLLEKKLQSLQGKSGYERRTKAIRFALNRGFSMSEILECLGEIEEE
ncbi:MULTISPECIES: regulatory protein RecX [Petrimonas]|jgi:regulatory protein|nr:MULTISPECIES: regulatory protein RecX [Petrimonas]MDD3561028.1 regulatory protein RecX [Petrimonas mucosa]SFU53241.1 regulatory protein [Porphyromonadaceae bacterium KHP3R9]HHT29454.1 RecX family transcriptional regulator [Petrimonas mucosa]